MAYIVRRFPLGSFRHGTLFFSLFFSRVAAAVGRVDLAEPPRAVVDVLRDQPARGIRLDDLAAAIVPEPGVESTGGQVAERGGGGLSIINVPAPFSSPAVVASPQQFFKFPQLNITSRSTCCNYA